ncbi:MAG: hypothetical protein EHM35_06160, partial [Planctomycetaceae bacterium]
MPIPCDCCPTGPPACALVGTILDGTRTEVFTGGPGVAPVGGAGNPATLARWSDGDITGANFTGYTSPGVQLTAITSPIIEIEFTAPHNGVRGLREWNQGGGDLSDFDGFSSWDFEFFAGAVSLATGNMVMGNGGAPFTHLLPGGQTLNGVTKLRLSNMRKLNPGSTVSPLVREVQVLEIQTVFPCRRRTGALEWYDANGNLVPTADVMPCGPCEPMTVSDLSLTGVSFNFAGDGSGADEYLSIDPLASSTAVGTVLVAPNHYHASVASTNSSCGGKNVRVTFLPSASFDIAYEGFGGSAVG